MAKHICTGNDHINALAAGAGFRSPKPILDANGSLTSRRKNPGLLLKTNKTAQGDSVEIPDFKTKEEDGKVKDWNKFKVEKVTTFLRIRILTDDFRAIANAAYELTVPGLPAPLAGKTNAQGQIEHEIPRAATEGELTVRIPAPASEPAGNTTNPPAGTVRGDVPITWKLQIGALGPIMENAPDRWCVAGVQQRLNNLCLNTGPVDGILGPNTTASVKAFQSLFGGEIKVDGKPGQGETQPKLELIHDKPDSVQGPLPKPAAGGGAGSP